MDEIIDALITAEQAEKMKNFGFTLEDGLCVAENPSEARPKVVSEAYQVMECTWVSELDHAEEDIGRQLEDGCYPGPYRDFNGITSQYGAHFILKIDKILMKKKYSDAIINGVRAQDFPPLPVDYGYRDSTNFWYTTFPRLKKPVANKALIGVFGTTPRLPPNTPTLDTVQHKLCTLLAHTCRNIDRAAVGK